MLNVKPIEIWPTRALAKCRRTLLRNMPPKRRIGAGRMTAQAKQQARRAIGRLSEARLRPTTVAKYNKAVVDFLEFLAWQEWEEATNLDDLDIQISDYIEYLWDVGWGTRNMAGFVINGTCHYLKKRRILPRSWDLWREWGKREKPHQAPPLPLKAWAALVGWAVKTGHADWAAVVLIGYSAFLRSAEMCALRWADLEVQTRSRRCSMVLHLSNTKTSQGAVELVVIDDAEVVRLVEQIRSRIVDLNAHIYAESLAQFRTIWCKGLRALSLEQHVFTPHSIRRGGAVHIFSAFKSLDTTIERGRWKCISTARLYINEGLNELQNMQLQNARHLESYHEYVKVLPDLF